MKVVLISNSLQGGANRAMLRHHNTLKQKGLDAHILVGKDMEPNSASIHSIPRLVRREGFAVGRDPLMPFAMLTRLPFMQDVDIVELRSPHNGHGSPYLDLKMLPGLSRRFCFVYRLSDMWALTGFCTYAFDCVKWKSGCHDCPQIIGNEKNRAEVAIPGQDISQAVYAQKKQAFGRSQVHVVCPSMWMLKNVRQGVLNHAASQSHIPVGVDVDLFEPHSGNQVRKKMGIAEDVFLVMANIPNPRNYRKAYDLLIEILSACSNLKNIELLLVGPSSEDVMATALGNMAVHIVPYIEKESDIVPYYQAADVFLLPSRCDNSAQVLVEAAACGVPSVAFEVCGNMEYCRHMETGLTARPYDVVQFSQCIRNLTDVGLRNRLSLGARKAAVEEWSTDKQANRFIELYQSIIQYKKKSNGNAF
jgi:glycosyltransferase involved in cell wall biosynthesis